MNSSYNTFTTLESELLIAKLQSVKHEVILNEIRSSLIELKEKIEKDNRTIKRLQIQCNLSNMVVEGQQSE